MDKRRYKRYHRRLEVEFSTGTEAHRGITSDLSERGLFIRTRRGLAPGSVLDMVLYLPNGQKSRLKGLVKHTTKTYSHLVKDGMGVELLSWDANYLGFISSFRMQGPQQPPQAEESIILTCPSCGAKNRLPKSKLSLGPRCGRCKSPLR